jgi:hypothetical protein
MKDGDSKKLDPRTLLALSQARPKPGRRMVPILISVAVLLVALTIIGYFLWPTDPPRVAVAAYDAVARAGDPIDLHARVEKEDGEKSNRLGGLELHFGVPASKFDTSAKTDEQGAAEARWPAPSKGGPVAEFTVIHDLKREKHVVRDSGRAFFWPPKETKLLVVDADHALIYADDETLRTARPTELKPREGAPAELTKLAASYKIVYLTSAMDQPQTYKKLRTWLRQPALPSLRLPDGPLLGPFEPLGEGDRELFTIGQIEALKKSFPGEALGIAGRPVEAKMFLDAGWRTILIGKSSDAPKGAAIADSWSDVPKLLPH